MAAELFLFYQEKYSERFFIFAAAKMLRSVIGNTSDSGSEEFRFEP